VLIYYRHVFCTAFTAENKLGYTVCQTGGSSSLGTKGLPPRPFCLTISRSQDYCS